MPKISNQIKLKVCTSNHKTKNYFVKKLLSKAINLYN